MVDNFVRILLGAELDEKQIDSDIKKLESKTANLRVGITGLDDISIVPRLDTSALSKQIESAFNQAKTNFKVSLEGGQNIVGDSQCCERLASILDNGLTRIEGQLSRIEATFKPSPLEANIIPGEAKAASITQEGFKQLTEQGKNANKTARDSVQTLKEIVINTKTDLFQSALAGIGIGAGQQGFSALASRFKTTQQGEQAGGLIGSGAFGGSLGGLTEDALRDALAASGAISPDLAADLAQKLTAPLEVEIASAINDGIGEVSVDDLVNELLSPLQQEVSESIQDGVDSVVIDFPEIEKTEFFSGEDFDNAINQVDELNFKLEAFQDTFKKIEDRLEDAEFRIQPSTESLQFIDSLKILTESLKTIDVGLDPDKAKVLAANFEKTGINLSKITKLQTEQIPKQFRGRESASLLRSQQASVTKLLKKGQQIIKGKGIQLEPKLVPLVGDDVLNKIAEQITSQVQGIKKTGEVIVGEIVEGISQGLNTSDVKEAGNAIATELQDSIKDPLEIASPSKWAEREVGENVNKGISEGMKENIALVEDATKFVTDTIKSTFEKTVKVAGIVGDFIQKALGAGPAVLSVAQFTAISAAVGAIARATLPAAIGLENVKRQLIAVGRVNTDAIIAEFTDLSNSVGASIDATLEGFARFATITRGTSLEAGAKDIFKNLAAGFASAGIGAQAQGRAFAAIEQVLGKGVVQSEELKGQLSEALPQTLGIAARAIGLTERELLKLVGTGELLAEEFVPAFASQFERETNLLRSLSVDQVSVGLTKLENQITSITQTIGSIFIPGFNAGLKVLNAGLGIVTGNLERLILLGTSATSLVLIPSFIRLGQTLITLASPALAAAKALLGINKVQELLVATGGKLSPVLLSIGKTLGAYAGLSIVVASLFQEFNKGTKDIDIAIKSARQFSKILREIDGIDISFDAAQIQQVINPFGLANERVLVQARGVGFLQRIVSLFNDEVKESQERLVSAAKIAQAIGPNSQAIEDFSRRVAETDLAQVNEELAQIDARASRLRTALSEASRAGDTEQARALQEEINNTIQESVALKNSLRDAIGVDPSILERNLDIIEQRFEELNAEAPGIFTDVEAEAFTKRLQEGRKELQDGARALNSVLAGAKGRVFEINLLFQGLDREEFNRQFVADLTRGIADIENLSSDFSESVRNLFTEDLEITGLTEGITSAANDINKLLESFNIETVQGITSVQNLADKLGIEGVAIEDVLSTIADTVSPETIKQILDAEGDGLEAGLKKDLEIVERITSLRLQQVDQQRNLAELNSQIIESQNQQLTSLRQAASEGFGKALEAGISTDVFSTILRDIGQVTQGEIREAQNSAELLNLFIDRQGEQVSRVEQAIGARRARFETQLASDLARELQGINDQISTGQVSASVGAGLKASADIRARLAESNNEIGLLQDKLIEINKLERTALLSSQTKNDALNTKRQEGIAIQGKINQLLEQGVSADDARIKRLEFQAKQTEQIQRLLTSQAIGLDPGQRDQLIAETERAILDAQQQAQSIKLELDTTNVENAINEIKRIKEISIKLIDQEKLSQEIDLLSRQVSGSATSLGDDLQGFINFSALGDQQQALRSALSSLDQEIERAIATGVSVPAIQQLRQERRDLVGEIQTLNKEILTAQLSFQQQFKDSVSQFTQDFASAAQANAAAASELEIFRLERAGADPREILDARLNALQQEKSIELELLQIDQARQLLAAKQLQLETQIAAEKARQKAVEAVEIFRENPEGLFNESEALRAVRELQLAEQQAALAEAGVGQLAKIAELTQDTLGKQFQLGQERIIAEAEDAGVRGVTRRTLTPTGIQQGVLGDITQSLNRLGSEQPGILQEFIKSNSLDEQRNVLLDQLVSLNRPENDQIANAIKSTSGLGLLGGLGGFNQAGLGVSALGGSIARQRRVSDRRLEEAARREIGQRPSVAVEGGININFEVAPVDANPDLARDVGDEVIARIAAAAQEVAR